MRWEVESTSCFIASPDGKPVSTFPGRALARRDLLDIRPERGLFGPAVRAPPVRWDVGEGCSRPNRLLRQTARLFVDEVAASADEAALGAIGRRRGCVSERARRRGARRKNPVADGDLAAVAHDQIDAEIFVTEGGTERTWNIEIAAAGRWIDIGGAAAAVLAIDREYRAADPDLTADPIELLPGLGAVGRCWRESAADRFRCPIAAPGCAPSPG